MASILDHKRTIHKDLVGHKRCQQVTYQEVAELGTAKVLIKIVSDSVSHQCSATISVWQQGGGWTVLHSIPYLAMKTKPGLTHEPHGVLESAFEGDISLLLAVAMSVLA